MERRPSALDHGAGGNRVSGFEFRRGALPAKPGSILRRPEAHRKKIASDQHVGLFATVIGLLSWVSLAAQIVLIAAEINAVRSTGLWPRSLRGAMTAADRDADGSYAQSALHDPRETITVGWADKP